MKKKKTEVAVQSISPEDRMHKRTRILRSMFRKEQVGGPDTFKRTYDEKDPFEGLYEAANLLSPVYAFNTLYRLYEESDVLQACIEAMQNNVDGFGYKMLFLGDDLSEKDLPDAQKELQVANDFFGRVNEKQSFAALRKLMRLDYEVLGNSAMEVVRNKKGEVTLLYHVPFSKLRLVVLQGEPIETKVKLNRGGKEMQMSIFRFFRKYCQVREDGKSLRYFKEFGDPRMMDLTTGNYGQVGAATQATEIVHRKNEVNGMAYGLPRWIGTLLSVKGRRLAEFVNHDLFENQGIPPIMVMVTGGTLTDESIEDLRALVRSMRGVEQFNRWAILEALPEPVGLDDKGTAKLEIKNLQEYRQEDQMFSRYLSDSAKCVRHRYRLPPLYVGATEVFTFATAKAAQTVAEEQVFVPERLIFDEFINMALLPEINVTRWSYMSKGPRIVGGQDIMGAIDSFAKAGAMTINHAIDRANEVLGLEMSKYKAPWADYPINLVIEIVKSGRINPDQIIDGIKVEELPKPVINQVAPGGDKKGGAKVIPIKPNKEQLAKAMKSVKASKIGEETKAFLENLLVLLEEVEENLQPIA